MKLLVIDFGENLHLYDEQIQDTDYLASSPDSRVREQISVMGHYFRFYEDVTTLRSFWQDVGVVVNHQVFLQLQVRQWTFVRKCNCCSLADWNSLNMTKPWYQLLHSSGLKVLHTSNLSLNILASLTNSSVVWGLRPIWSCGIRSSSLAAVWVVTTELSSTLHYPSYL